MIGGWKKIVVRARLLFVVFCPFATILMLALAGCDRGRIISERVVVVSGSVIESGGGAPIDSAWISMRPMPSTFYEVYSDSSGAFSFASWPFSHDSLFAGKQGYRTTGVFIADGLADVKGIVIKLDKSPS